MRIPGPEGHRNGCKQPFYDLLALLSYNIIDTIYTHIEKNEMMCYDDVI